MKEKKHIHGFKEPKDYFENFEASLMVKMETEKLVKETGFVVPENYFETLENSLIAQVETPKEEPKVISLFTRKRVLGFIAIAACFTLIITIFNRPDTISFDDLENTTIADYFSEEHNDLANDDLVALLDDEAITSLAFETAFTSEKIIEEYLIEVLDDNTLLLE